MMQAAEYGALHNPDIGQAASPLSLEGRELRAERRILHGDGRMTAEEESRERNRNRMQVGIEPRFLDWKAIKVKPLSENQYWRTSGLLPIPRCSGQSETAQRLQASTV
jgi:hypothetical protein